MMPGKQPKKRRRLAWAALLLLMAAGIFTALVSSRFHFSNQAFPRLARLQGNHQTRFVPDGSDPVLIGHRGAGLASTKKKGLVVGNTCNAIQAAVDAGVDWIEIDIRRSADGQLVVFHDETIDLKTSGAGAVSELDLGQLQSVDVLADPVEKILSLEEAFAKFHSPDRKWVLDIKAIGLKDQVLAWVNENLSTGQVILFGTWEVLQEYRGCGYSLGYTAIWKNPGNRLRVLFWPSQIIRRCESLGCDYLVLPVIFCNQSLVDEAAARRIEVWVYGTDDQRDLLHLAGRGIGGFITDHPLQASRLFAGRGDEPRVPAKRNPTDRGGKALRGGKESRGQTK